MSDCCTTGTPMHTTNAKTSVTPQHKTGTKETGTTTSLHKAGGPLPKKGMPSKAWMEANPASSQP